MLIIIGIAIISLIRNLCDSFETTAKDYEERVNDGWIDYRSEGFRA